jgi:peroxiredoxin
MPTTRALIAGVAVLTLGGAALGAVLLTRSAPPPAEVGSRLERPVTAAPEPREARAPKPRAGKRLTLDQAVRDLDLIRPARPKPASDFTVRLAGGQRFRLAEQRGKVVLINFWATWCPPCREEMPSMERLWQQHRDNGFVLVAVSVDAKTEVVQPFVGEHKLTFPVAVDPAMDVANLYGVKGLPSSFVVGPAGDVVALAVGPRAWDGDAAHSLIERIAGLP